MACFWEREILVETQYKSFSLFLFSAHILPAVTVPDQDLKLSEGKDFSSNTNAPEHIKTDKYTQSQVSFPHTLGYNENKQNKQKMHDILVHCKKMVLYLQIFWSEREHVIV